MLYIIRDIVFIILAIIGLVQIARSVVLFFMRSKKDGDVIMVVPIRGHDEEAEIVLLPRGGARQMGRRRPV